MRKNEEFQRVKILKKEYTQLKEAERNVESAKIYKRIQAFKLIYKKWRYSAIADFLSVAKNTISEWVKIYQQDGIDALITLKYKGGQPKLNKKQLLELKEEARKGNFNVAKDVQHYIKTKWDIKYNLSHIQLLSKKKLQLSFKKTRLIPNNPPNEEKQKEVIRKIKEHLHNRNTLVLFFDPCHLQHTVVNARMWQPKGEKGTIKIKSNSKKKRINILGALDLKNFSIITTLTEKKCSTERIVEFIQKIKKKYPDQDIVIILDNAQYNHANYTTVYAELSGIELFFLPPYSPNLNIIERLWKFSKKKLVHNVYYEKFEQFNDKVCEFFDNLDKYQKELKCILNEKFQIIHTD